jgi:hypothetical protein
MSHDPSSLGGLLPYVANIARNPVRVKQLSGKLFSLPENCEVCTTPTDGWPRCYQCNEQRQIYGTELADLVVPLSYAVKGHPTLGQFYTDLWNYKSDRAPETARLRLSIMCLFFQQLHSGCVARRIGSPADFFASVPSGRNRPLPHPLEGLRAIVSGASRVAVARYVAVTRGDRATGLDPEQFAFNEPLTGHVQIVEDTWVKGQNAQSVAVAAKRAGATAVSIVVLGRVLDNGWQQSTGWIADNLVDAQWTPDICPVTGGECP